MQVSSFYVILYFYFFCLSIRFSLLFIILTEELESASVLPKQKTKYTQGKLPVYTASLFF